ncbi:hypothetical protein [Aeromonas media]|uniref:hypothetical protein n=1 Tax=Aeromonas media TaxID=651 RepID=UPI003D22A201
MSKNRRILSPEDKAKIAQQTQQALENLNNNKSGFEMLAETVCSPEQLEANKVENERNVQSIDLCSGRSVRFYKTLLLSKDVENLTVVDDLNPRSQEHLTHDTTSDIDDSIGSSGVVFGVWAQLMPDGRYSLIDGSRRRYEAIKHGLPLPIWYTREELTTAEKISFIHTGRLSKSFSYYENGRMLCAYQDEFGIDIDAACKIFSISKPTYSRQINAYKLIPMSIYNLFKSKIDMGNTELFALITVMRGLHDIDYSLVEKISGMAEQMESFESDSKALDWVKKTVIELTGVEPKSRKKKKKKNEPVSQSVIGGIKLDQYDDHIKITLDKNFDIERLYEVLKTNFEK